MKKSKMYFIPIVVILLIGSWIVYSKYTEAQNMIGVKLYDKNGNEMKKLFSVVQGNEGVYYISFVVKVKNTGEIPLTVSIQEASPNALSLALGNPTKSVKPGETAIFESNKIETAQFEGQTVTFRVKVRASYQYAGSINTLDIKEGVVTLKIDKDPSADYQVEIVSSTGSSNSAGGCYTTSTTIQQNQSPICLSSGTSCSLDSECCSKNCVAKTTHQEIFISSPRQTIAMAQACGNALCPTEYTKCKLYYGSSSTEVTAGSYVGSYSIQSGARCDYYGVKETIIKECS